MKRESTLTQAFMLGNERTRGFFIVALFWVAALLALISPAYAHAADFVEYSPEEYYSAFTDDETEIVDEDTATALSYEGKSKSVTVPKTFNGKIVTEVSICNGKVTSVDLSKANGLKAADLQNNN